jgi:type IV secretory pathway VirB10-like protein
MAMLDLACMCGFRFQVPRPEPGGPKSSRCPSCGAPVVIVGAAGRSEGSATKPPVKAILIGGAGVLVLAVLGIAWMALSGRENPYEAQVDAEERKAAPKPTAVKPALKAPASAAAVAPSKPKPAAVPAKASAGTPPGPAPVEVPKPSPEPKPAPAAAPTSRSAVTPEAARRVKDEMLSLPPFYLNSLLDSALQARYRALAGGAPGTEEEAVQISALLTGPRLKAVKDDQARIAEGLAPSEKDAEAGLPVDRLVMVAGNIVQCRIVEENAEYPFRGYACIPW